MMRFCAKQEEEARIARIMLTGKENSPFELSVRIGRASIPCNPNTIFDVGNLINPIYILKDKTNQRQCKIDREKSCSPKPNKRKGMMVEECPSESEPNTAY